MMYHPCGMPPVRRRPGRVSFASSSRIASAAAGSWTIRRTISSNSGSPGLLIEDGSAGGQGGREARTAPPRVLSPWWLSPWRYRTRAHRRHAAVGCVPTPLLSPRRARPRHAGHGRRRAPTPSSLARRRRSRRPTEPRPDAGASQVRRMLPRDVAGGALPAPLRPNPGPPSGRRAQQDVRRTPLPRRRHDRVRRNPNASDSRTHRRIGTFPEFAGAVLPVGFPDSLATIFEAVTVVGAAGLAVRGSGPARSAARARSFALAAAVLIGALGPRRRCVTGRRVRV